MNKSLNASTVAGTGTVVVLVVSSAHSFILNCNFSYSETGTENF